MKKPEFLILDDSASALDFATDAALRKALHSLSGNVTTFLVSQRAASIRQADLILVPANWPGRRREHWISLLQARAIENLCYIAGVNCVGDMDGQTYTGDSRLYGPDGVLCSGETLMPADAQPGECAFIYEIDDQVKKVRTQFPVKKDRRDALYRQFYEI